MTEIKTFSDFLIIILPIIFTFLGFWAKKTLLNYRSRRFELKEHTLFSSINSYLREIRTWQIQENRNVFIDAFAFKLKIWRENFLRLSEDLQNAKYNDSKLESEILDYVNTTIIEYINIWKINKIPTKVISRINDTHNEKVEYFIEKIKSKCRNNDMYPAYMLKVIAIYDVLELLLAETINDLNTLVFRNVYNGHFKGVYYQGIPINDEQFKKFQQDKNK